MSILTAAQIVAVAMPILLVAFFFAGYKVGYALGRRAAFDRREVAASQAVVRAVNGMLANPVARTLLLRARRVADPKAVIPERYSLAVEPEVVNFIAPANGRH
jgi:hypothetical protein